MTEAPPLPSSNDRLKLAINLIERAAVNCTANGDTQASTYLDTALEYLKALNTTTEATAVSPETSLDKNPPAAADIAAGRTNDQGRDERDRGPWNAEVWDKNEPIQVVIQSDDFHHDVALVINGDFADSDSLLRYGQWLAEVLTKATSQDETTVPHPLAIHAFCASSQEFKGDFRLTIGFDTLEQVQAAHEYIVQVGKRAQSTVSEPR